MSDIDRGDDRADDRLDELLRSAARDYNRPPDTPRERMWSRIEARRRASGAWRSALGTPAEPDPAVIPLRRPTRAQWVRWAVGIAAALLLGFGIGRLGGRAEPGASGPNVAVTPESTRTAPAGSAAPVEAARRRQDVAAVQPGAEATSTQVTPPRQQHLARGPVAGEPRGSGEGRARLNAECQVPSPECRVPNAAYTLAAIQHLTQAEALLTSFRAEARSGKQVDAQLSAWAKDLLVSTRLMLDSPAGRDPRMHRLLEDLELVLAQIAQLSTQRAGDELNLIDQAVEGRNVLPRLRTTIPAGVRPVGS